MAIKAKPRAKKAPVVMLTPSPMDQIAMGLAFVVLLFLVVFSMITFAEGGADSQNLSAAGTSRLAHFEQAMPTYIFAYWLEEPAKTYTNPIPQCGPHHQVPKGAYACWSNNP